MAIPKNKESEHRYLDEEEDALALVITYRKPRQERGLLKFEKILDAANDLIELKGVHNFSLYDIADHAEVATGSVYHFFPNIEAVFAALVERYDREFERIVSENISPEKVESWGDVLWHHIEKSRMYINSNKQVLILILGPGQTWQTKQVDTVGDTAIARAMHRNIREYFAVPEHPDAAELLHIAIRILESTWQLSYQRHGKVTTEMQKETYRAMCAYLELYWPKYLPRITLAPVDQ
jgi:AcrR family transcriptional regulator